MASLTRSSFPVTFFWVLITHFRMCWKISNVYNPTWILRLIKELIKKFARRAFVWESAFLPRTLRAFSGKGQSARENRGCNYRSSSHVLLENDSKNDVKSSMRKNVAGDPHFSDAEHPFSLSLASPLLHWQRYLRKVTRCYRVKK